MIDRDAGLTPSPIEGMPSATHRVSPGKTGRSALASRRIAAASGQHSTSSGTHRSRSAAAEALANGPCGVALLQIWSLSVLDERSYRKPFTTRPWSVFSTPENPNFHLLEHDQKLELFYLVTFPKSLLASTSLDKMVGNYHRETGAADPIIQRLADEDKTPWYKKPNLRYMYFWLFITCMGIEITSGFDSQMINALQNVDPWKLYFNDPQGTDKSLLTASYSLGAVLSLPFVPWTSNKLGRRWSILCGSLILCAGAILQGASRNTGMYVAARIILGFGIPTAIVNGSALLGELGHPKERPYLTSFFNVSYFVGQILAAGICFRTNKIPNDWAWRIPSYLQVCPSLFQITFVLLLPESPRWLIAKDRHDEAAAILYKYHAEGDTTSEFVRAELAEIQTTIKLELEASKDSWWDLLRDKGMRKRSLVTAMLGLFTQWSGNTLTSYYQGDILGYVGMTDSQDKQTFNLGNSCWNLVNAVISAILVKRFRRRTMYLTCTIALLCVYIGWTISYRYAVDAVNKGGKNKNASNATMAFMLMYPAAYNIGYNALTYTYLVELWPFALRSRGITFFQLFGRLANFFNTFINPIALKDIQWKYLITYCVWLGWEITFVYFFFPETTGRTLEELAWLFEDKDLSDRAVLAAEKVIHGGPEVEEDKGATAGHVDNAGTPVPGREQKV